MSLPDIVPDIERGAWRADEPEDAARERRVAFKELATIIVCGCVSLYIISSYVERFQDWGWLRHRLT